MSNYTVTTNFAAKDLLASGNAAKAVKGADLTTEFNNIATMSTTKVDAGSAASLASLTVTGAITAKGIPVYATKAANTSRASTTTITNDPDLAITIGGAGTYAFVLFAPFTGVAPGGITGNVNFSGTFTSAASSFGLTPPATGSPSLSVVLPVASTTTSNLFGAVGGSGLQGVFATGSLVATGAGTFAFAWAQSSSNASATAVQQGSYLTVMQVA